MLDHTRKEASCQAEGAGSVRELIGFLGDRYGGAFAAFLLDDETCLFLINGAATATLGGLDAPLRPGDEIDVLPFVDGG